MEKNKNKKRHIFLHNSLMDTLEVLLHGVGWGMNNNLDGKLIKVMQLFLYY